MLNSAAPCSPSQNTLNQTQATKQRRLNLTKWLAVCGQHLALKDVIMYK